MDLSETIKSVAENIVLFGGAAMGLYYGVRRVYTTARNVEKLVESSEKNTIQQKTVQDELVAHTKLEDERNHKRDQKMETLSKSLEELAADLRAHVKMEEDRDLIRDQQLIQLTDHMEEIVSEMRPNGGSSMKDILTKASQKVDEVHTRVSILEQWKDDHPDGAPKKRVAKPKKMVRRSGRR